MSLADILAKKKALSAGVQVVEQAVEKGTQPSVAPAPAPAPVAQAAPAPQKELTFAEKMALKKAQAAQPAVVAPVAAPATTNTPLVVATQKLQAAAPQQEDTAEGTEVRQAYAEIASKIDELASFSTEELSGAMSSLKKALMQNPAACELMLDEDIGKMVVALRRVTNTTIAEAKAGKTPAAKKPKAIDVKNLSADEMLQAWEEL